VSGWFGGDNEKTAQQEADIGHWGDLHFGRGFLASA
jgi:hypothetical protein